MIGKPKEGLSLIIVAEEFGINKSVISCSWKPFQTIGTAVTKNPRKTTAVDDRFIVLQAKRARNHLHEFFELPCQDINATRRKRLAERMRDCGRLRRNVVESELVQEPQHQVSHVEGSEDATLSNNSDFYRHRLAQEELKINHTHTQAFDNLIIQFNTYKPKKLTSVCSQ
ncbi:uncharacterized protein TNCV_207551 [Trichonephila clavipes]|nr:uncharacterized protein TNCV_207551 [Trichonephila clavipes]